MYKQRSTTGVQLFNVASQGTAERRPPHFSLNCFQLQCGQQLTTQEEELWVTKIQNGAGPRDSTLGNHQQRTERIPLRPSASVHREQ